MVSKDTCFLLINKIDNIFFLYLYIIIMLVSNI